MSGVLHTKRGRVKFSFDGYMYTMDRKDSSGAIQFWRCEFKNTCKARLHTRINTNEVVKGLGEHSDPSDAAAVEVAEKTTALKQQARSTQETPSQLLSDFHDGMSVAGQGCLPAQESSKRKINRARNADSQAPTCPLTRAALRIPANYARYESEPGIFEPFLLGDSDRDRNWDSDANSDGEQGDNERILIFGRAEVKNWVHLVKKIYVDGTFSLAPELFSQIVVVLAERGGYAIPICYALLPDKSHRSYCRMIELIEEAFPTLHPEAVSVDFELALINAFKLHFPDATMHDCFFHLVRNMKKKIGVAWALKEIQE